MEVIGYGAQSGDKDLEPMIFDRIDVRDGEVEIEITHCGMCHSDLHQVRNDWGNTMWPSIPGHEIVGIVRRVGDGVTKVAEGDRVGVGCMVNSCQECPECKADEEQYCTGPHSCTLTYNGAKAGNAANTYGGYTEAIIVREEFVITIPDALDMESAGPILCAGITVYAPMKKWALKEGQRLAVAGIGGLGHMAVKIGKALGAEVVALSRSTDSFDDIREMGADIVVDPRDEDAMAELAGTVDLMITTIPVAFDIAPYMALMNHDGVINNVGNMIEFPAFSPGPMVFNRITLSGSLIGGIKDTQEVIDLCARHGIAPMTKLIGVDGINDALKRLESGGEGDYRHVIDMATLKDRHDEMKGAALRVDNPDRGEVVGR